MGTTYSVTVASLPRAVRREAIQSAIDGVLDEVNRALSTYDSRSEISRFNANATTDPMVVSPSLRAVAVIAGEVSVATGGAFDITVGPLVQAWGFGVELPASEIAPGPGVINGLRAEVGFDRLELGADGRSLRKTVPGLQLDVNGIAPGYAVDLIAERFDALGVRDYLVELGGEVRARGSSPAGRPWRVAVEAPLSGERKPYALVELDGLAVSTSGDYRDFRELNGRRFSHTIDPRTGAPVTHGLASVSVVHPSAAFRRRIRDGADGARAGGRHGACRATGPRRPVHRTQRGRSGLHGTIHARVRSLAPPAALTAIIPEWQMPRRPGRAAVRTWPRSWCRC